MANAPKILCFAGSLRQDSYNKKLVKIAMQAAKEGGAEATFIDLKDFPMPIYDGDIEAESGLPETAKQLKKIFKEHQGFLISSPEYNSSYSAALKNAIDWVSRPEPGEKPLEMFSGKVAGVMAASPGALGGLRGLVTLRMLLGNINVLVVPNQIAVSGAADAFDEKGNLKDEKKQAQVIAIGLRVAEVTKAICSAD